MTRTLIINADDLGYTQGVNLAIARSSREGILRSATLMANGEAFDGAVEIAKENPALGVGVHLTLTELPPLSPPGEIEGLTDENGLLLPSPTALMAAILAGRVRKEAIRKELDRQVSKVIDHGVAPTHIDSHKHVHALPLVMQAAAETAKKHSIKWIRNPFDRISAWKTLPLLESDKRWAFCKQHIKSKMIAVFRSDFLKRVKESGLRTPDRFYGVSLTGLWNESSMVSLLDRLSPGITEWMVHPGDCDPQLRLKRTRLVEERERERDLLLSPEIRARLQKRGIALRHFGEEI